MDIQNNQNDKPKGLGYFESFKIKKGAEFALTNSAPLQMMHYITSNKKNLLGQMSSFEFLGWLFASQKTGFSGLRYRFIPSLRFGTGFASPYNPCHGLKSNTRN